jgi:uncharacterized protein YgbK (DUF1537 family)
MRPVCVIADDFTGAAEMAGIAWRFGHRTTLSRDLTAPPTGADVVVYDASTRSLSPADAASRVGSFCRAVAGGQLFKKIDSVLRGNVLPEACAAMRSLQRGRAIILAQNPSRGRTIEDGIYRIDGVPITQTPFHDDPDHPAMHDEVVARLDPVGAYTARSIAAPSHAPRSGIILADAATPADVERWAAELTDDDLPVGGADMFTALLARWRGTRAMSPITLPPATRRLHVCGTASRPPEPRLTLAQLARPSAISVSQAQQQRTAVSVYIGGPVDRTPRSADRLQRDLVASVAPSLRARHVDQLLVEGGATAAALFESLGWSRFQTLGELAVGVVALRPIGNPDIVVITKPGSYDWPTMLYIA